MDEAKTGIATSDILSIFLCHNGRLHLNDENRLFEFCKEQGIKVHVIDIDNLAQDLFLYFPKLASDYLAIEIDSGQILSLADFLSEYHKNPFSTRLDTAFFSRDKELEDVLALIESHDIVILSGEPGVGKSRLAIEALTKFHNSNSDWTVYCLFNKQGISFYNDLKDYLGFDGNYLVFVDDANRVSELQHLLRLIHDNSATRNIRIVLTVREYAQRSVLEITKGYDNSSFALKPFEKDKLRSFISAEFGITNVHFLERIESVAKGNARIAVMAATIAKKTDRYESLLNVEDIYDHYFESVEAGDWN
ncbi:MAG: hypothetical protein ACKVRN_07890 [Pyrinomonadaceae bacterium]